MAESAVKRLLVHTSHYSLSSFLTMVAGLVSFPLLTRIFSVADYGMMNLIGSTLAVTVALGKVGVQHSIVRYQSEISAGKGRYSLRQLTSTTLLGMAGTALIAMAVLLVIVHFVPARWLADPRLRLLFSMATLLIFVQVIESNFINFLRAEQATTTLLKYQVAKRYLGLGLILTAVFFVSRTLRAFYSASIVTEALALTALAYYVFRRRGWSRPSFKDFSRPLYTELLKFGIPMMIGYEMSGIILAVGDRYVIEGTIGETPLGLYSAAYNLCQYVQAVFIASVSQAIMPIYMQMWDEKGVDETAAFIARSMRTYVLLGAPLIAGLASVGPELLPSLASDKYATGALIIPWVIAGMFIEGGNAMVGAGLFIHRKTRVIMAIVLSCALANVGLNLILVPRIGILGAAIATLMSYGASALLLAFAARRLLPVKLPWATMARAGLAALVMYLALRNILPGRRLITVCVRPIVGMPIYAGIVYLIDRDAREVIRGPLERLRRIMGGSPAAETSRPTLVGGLKRQVKTVLAKPGVWERVGPLLRRPGVVVLTYHDVFTKRGAFEGISAEVFAAQMRWLRENCETIAPDSLVEHTKDARRARPAVLVTFDDGYRSYHDLAYPVLKELGIPALVFIATSFMDDGGMMWTDEVQWAAAASSVPALQFPWSNETMALPDAAARKALGARARAHLKTLPDVERRTQMKALVSALGTPPARERSMLTWEEVRSTMDLTTYGGHSHTHPILSQLDSASMTAEIKTCNERLAAETGRPSKFFAYPNGGPRDYTAETKELLRANGFELAFTTTEGIAGPETDWMEIKRVSCGDMSVPAFAWTVAGLKRS